MRQFFLELIESLIITGILLLALSPALGLIWLVSKLMEK